MYENPHPSNLFSDPVRQAWFDKWQKIFNIVIIYTIVVVCINILLTFYYILPILIGILYIWFLVECRNAAKRGRRGWLTAFIIVEAILLALNLLGSMWNVASLVSLDDNTDIENEMGTSFDVFINFILILTFIFSVLTLVMQILGILSATKIRRGWGEYYMAQYGSYDPPLPSRVVELHDMEENQYPHNHMHTTAPLAKSDYPAEPTAPYMYPAASPPLSTYYPPEGVHTGGEPTSYTSYPSSYPAQTVLYPGSPSPPPSSGNQY